MLRGTQPNLIVMFEIVALYRGTKYYFKGSCLVSRNS